MSSDQRQPGGQGGLDQRQVVGGELALQRLCLGADQHALAARRRGEGGRQQVGEALAHAGARLEEADAALVEDAGHGLGQLRLAGPRTKAGQSRRQAVRRGELVAPAGLIDGQAGRSGRGLAGRLVGHERRRRLGRAAGGTASRSCSGRQPAAASRRRSGSAKPAARPHRAANSPAVASASGSARCVGCSRRSCSAMEPRPWRSSSGYRSSDASRVSKDGPAGAGRP